jgi:hypothetical protein
MNHLWIVVAAVVLTVVVLAAGFAAFTGYVAYCGHYPFKLPDALDGLPRPDAARLGSVLEGGLGYAMRVSGAVLTVLGACLAIGRRSLEPLLGCVVVILAGAVLITQHWAAGIALGIAVLAAAGLALRQSAPNGTAGRQDLEGRMR